MNKRVLIIIPAYNEAENIERVVNDLIENFPQYDYIVVNDGSKKAADGTVEREGATTLDVAKRLLDFGFHAPTIYFPLLFHQAIMIEPTETESIETLDAFIEVMKNIALEAAEDPALLKSAPHNAPITRPDETTAARQPILKYQDEK